MLFRCLVLLFLLTTIQAQKGGRQGSASDVRSPSRILANRKIPQPSEPIQQVQEPEDRDPDEDREIIKAVIPRRPPAPRPQPQQPAEEEGHEPAPEPYSFSYSVDDPETGAASSREETQDANGEIVGYYHLKDADGRTRRVDYTAGKDGFKATIKSNEEGLNARAPADVSIELSASPSETRPSYALNNRPAATETSIKSFGRPTQGRFFERLIHALPAPIPPPIVQQIEQRVEEPLEAQISQTYESNSPSESLEIVQQKNIDEELPFESTPIKGIPVPPPQRPIGRFTPQRIQTHRENALVSLEPVIAPIAPITQVKEEVSNSIQDTQLPAESAPLLPIPAPIKGLLQQSYTQFRPLSPILGTIPIPLSPQQYQQAPVVQQVQQTVPNLTPLSAPSNNIVQEREPIVQRPLINYFNPLPINPIIQSPQYIVASPQPQPLVYSSINRLDNSYVRPQLINTGYRLNIDHNTAQIPQQTSQEVLVQEKVDDIPPEPIVQNRQPLFEPQVYEPISQTYEPLQQEAEDPAEESRAAPPSSPQCECAKQAESIVQPIKGSSSEQARVQVGRFSPFHAFLPQAFRSR